MLVWPFFRWLEEIPERRMYRGLPRGCWNCKYLTECRRPKEEGWKCYNGCRVIKEKREKLDSLYAQMETAKAELGKPFPQEAELRTKSARLAELNIELNIDDKTPIEALAEEAPPRAAIAKSAKPSVLQKLHSYGTQSRTEPKKTVEEVR